MNRVLTLVLLASIGNASAAFAEESLLKAGARHVQQLASTETTAAATANATVAPAGATATVGQKKAPSFQEQAGALSKSGMGKGKKTLIYVGLAVGFAASVYAIDQHVLNITPSSLGTRKD